MRGVLLKVEKIMDKNSGSQSNFLAELKNNNKQEYSGSKTIQRIFLKQSNCDFSNGSAGTAFSLHCHFLRFEVAVL